MMWVGELRVGMGILPGCLDTLGEGILLAVLREMRPNWRCPYPKAIVAVALVLLGITLTEGGLLHSAVLPFSMVSLFAMVPLVWVVSRASLGFGGWLGALLENPWLRYIGKI